MLEQWIRRTAARFPPAAGYVLVCLATGLGGLGLLAVTVAVGALCLVGTGFLLMPATLRTVCRYAEFHRRRVGKLLGAEVRTPYRGVDPGSGVPVPRKPSLRDPAVRKDLLWLLCHCGPGTVWCAVPLVVCGHAVNWLTAPLWWWLLPAQRDRIILLTVDSWWKASAAVVVGVLYAVVAMALMYPAALLHARTERRLLTARPRAGLAERVRELTASRAAALDAHDAELRRIERDLHDGAQAGIAAVSLRLGMVRRALDRRPEEVPGLLDIAQRQAEQALDSLRELVRGIYPPMLADRGLVEAVRALAGSCAVPTRVEIAGGDGVGSGREGGGLEGGGLEGGDAGSGGAPRAPAAAEAAAYFVVSEALANVAKHSGARAASVRLRVTAGVIAVRVEDDGRGGAVEGSGGTGLAGLRRRVAAFDGSTELSSPPGGPTVLRVEIPCGS